MKWGEAMTDLESQYVQRDGLLRQLRAAREHKDERAIQNLTAALERSHEQIARLLAKPSANFRDTCPAVTQVQGDSRMNERGFRQWLHRVRRLYRDLRRIAHARGVPPLSYREFIQRLLD